MITSVRWVPVGAARRVPIKEDIDAEMAVTEHMLAQQQEAAMELRGEGGEEKQEEEGGVEEMAVEGEEGEDDEDDGEEPLLQIGQDLEFEDNADDPHIDPDYHSDSNEDVEIQEGDQLILAAHTEDEQASLSVYLYNDELEQLYVHHDVMLPDMPLCVEWIGAAPMTREAGNWAAVGTLSPEIELWNLDILNATNPHAVLAAGAKSEGGKKSKKKNKKKDKARGELGGHSEAVLGLAWNKAQANVLASCSADATVRLWDLNETRCSAVFDRLHTSKIQSVLWSPSTASVLATGGFDRRARVADVRDVSSALTIALDADVECLRWVPGQPSQLLVATEAGEVLLFDVAQLAKGPVWRMRAHDKACTGLAMTARLPGLLVTVSLDKSLKIWSIASGRPALLVARPNQFGSGALFGVEISEATPYVCVVACEGENLQVFDFKTAVAGSMPQVAK